ncbi:MAG: metallopeptidase family protein [Pseudomonadota bacterium]
MAEEAFSALPDPFRQACGHVVVRVTDFADDDALRSVNLSNPWGLLGLYSGIPLTEGIAAEEHLPAEVWLYRNPILLHWIETPDSTIREILINTLVHEIGHHFGLSDDDMEEIESR